MATVYELKRTTIQAVMGSSQKKHNLLWGRKDEIKRSSFYYLSHVVHWSMLASQTVGTNGHLKRKNRF